MTSVELGENPSDVALLSFTPELPLINITNHGRSTKPAVQAFALFIIDLLSRLSAHQSRFKVCQAIFTRTEKEKLF